MFCCKYICIPFFELIPNIKCVHKYPSFYTQEIPTFDNHDPTDLKQEIRHTKFSIRNYFCLHVIPRSTRLEMSLTIEGSGDKNLASPFLI